MTETLGGPYTDLAISINQHTAWRLFDYCQRTGIEITTYPDRLEDSLKSQVNGLTKGLQRDSKKYEYAVLSNVPMNQLGELRKHIYGRILKAGTAIPAYPRSHKEVPRNQRI